MISNVDESNSVAQIFLNTNMAAACGSIAAAIVVKLMFGKADLSMALNGVPGSYYCRTTASVG